MARAGKVRGQTPKVQKQDKKKQPKGRAMKRIKYNRRFVNVGEFIERCLLAAHSSRLWLRAVHPGHHLCLDLYSAFSWRSRHSYFDTRGYVHSRQ